MFALRAPGVRAVPEGDLSAAGPGGEVFSSVDAVSEMPGLPARRHLVHKVRELYWPPGKVHLSLD